MKPARIVLSRKAGFDLQAVSHTLNGLPAQSVARPGAWGNPFTIAEVMAETGLGKEAAQAEAVARHARWMNGEISAIRRPPTRDAIRAALGGKNLACWCRAGTPCHVHTLLALANSDASMIKTPSLGTEF
ncbi:MAG: DUF4326 domain-containing protein [Devosia sp.]|jgi:hypothetical protein|uniref:DUF4326 domain-containing protein n=1 Tax=unclassified Devosia TaxID=196773 RepID=UPI0019F021CD|nr:MULTISPECIES: DUF4326 domain-containing protein [unclassified Devosia]MBF0677628.1 DUF4326 domain-containing protein [Devosia sp.]WEJ34314.1 DUF4326 domain-containing protein [Devosia sp. SD17-2]